MQPPKLPGHAGPDRADLGAGPAIAAAVGIDDEAILRLADRLLGALILAGPAQDALLGDVMGHGLIVGRDQDECAPPAGCFWQAGQRCVPRPLTRM